MFKLAIFLLENYPYHAAIIIENKKISDLSLLGARTIDINEFDFEIYKTFFFDLNIKNINEVLIHLNKPSIITKKIIEKERNERGWFKTKNSSDYILEFRKKRSRNLDDMNCIEWIIYALEIGKYEIPDNILTAKKLFEWSTENLKKTKIKYA